MAEPKENVLMEKIVSLCKRRGFIFQSSEIYGGINGFWDYGPLGAELKRNVKELWWNTMTRQRDDIAGLEATIIMHPKIWEASGHVSTFADPMSTCRQCKKLVRADQIWEMLPENAWAQAIAELCPGGLVEGGKLLAWAKGKGQRIAPNLALVRNPEVTLSFLAERIQNNPSPAFNHGTLPISCHRAVQDNRFDESMSALRRRTDPGSSLQLDVQDTLWSGRVG